VSVVAITLITAAFVVLLSVFNGFEGLVKSLYSSFYPDIRIGPASGKVITVSEEQLAKLQSIQGIKAFSKIVEEKALLQNGDLKTIVFLKGADDQYARVTEVPNKMIQGKFDLGNEEHPSIVLGGGIQHAVQVDVEKALYPLTVYLFKRGVSVNVMDPYQAFAADNIIGAGTFYIQQDIDNKYAITNIDFMKRMLGIPANEYSSIEIALRDPANSEQLKKEISSIFGKDYLVANRYEQDRGLY